MTLIPKYPIKVDPDGIVLKREDFDGHYVVMYHPRNDQNPEIKGGDPDVDWQLWHEVVKGRFFSPRLVIAKAFTFLSFLCSEPSKSRS